MPSTVQPRRNATGLTAKSHRFSHASTPPARARINGCTSRRFNPRNSSHFARSRRRNFLIKCPTSNATCPRFTPIAATKPHPYLSFHNYRVSFDFRKPPRQLKLLTEANMSDESQNRNITPSKCRRHFRWAILIALLAIIGISAAWYHFGRQESRITRAFTREMQIRLPRQLAMNGQMYAFQSVEVPRVTQGPKGYCLDVVIHWDGGTNSGAQALLIDNGFGRYTCDWNTGDLGHFSFSIPD